MIDAKHPLATISLAALLSTLAVSAQAQQTELGHPAAQPQTDQQVVGDPPQLPADFPDDVPLYPAMQSPTVARAGDGFTVRGQTPDSGVKVADVLTAAMVDRGWTRVADDRNPAAHHMMFRKGAREVDVMLTLEDQITLLRMQVPGEQPRES